MPARKTKATKTQTQTIGSRIDSFREEARLLAAYIQDELEDRYSEEAEEQDSDLDHALGFLQALTELESPSEAVAALSIDFQPRGGRSNLDKAKDLRDEFQAIQAAFEKSKLEDPEFSADLEEVSEWVGDF